MSKVLFLKREKVEGKVPLQVAKFKEGDAWPVCFYGQQRTSLWITGTVEEVSSLEILHETGDGSSTG